MEVKAKQIEVFLKKSKITKTLIKQLDNKNFLQLGDYKIIGWCKIDEVKKVISYNNKNGLLCTSRFLNNIKKEVIQLELIEKFFPNSSFIEDKYKHDGNFAVYYNYDLFKIFIDENEANDFINKCINYQKEVEQKGQFYI